MSDESWSMFKLTYRTSSLRCRQVMHGQTPATSSLVSSRHLIWYHFPHRQQRSISPPPLPLRCLQPRMQCSGASACCEAGGAVSRWLCRWRVDDLATSSPSCAADRWLGTDPLSALVTCCSSPGSVVFHNPSPAHRIGPYGTLVYHNMWSWTFDFIKWHNYMCKILEDCWFLFQFGETEKGFAMIFHELYGLGT